MADVPSPDILIGQASSPLFPSKSLLGMLNLEPKSEIINTIS